MRKVAAFSLAIVAMAGSSAFAGLATFSPDGQSVPAGTPVAMDITLSTQTNADFDSADIVINSPVPFDFAYNTAFSSKATGALTTPTPLGLGIAPVDLFVGGGGPNAFGAPVLLGTVTVDTTGLAPGQYEIFINGDLDGISNLTRQGNGESLSGSGTFNVVPEPATIGLLILGGLGGLIRRRTVG